MSETSRASSIETLPQQHTRERSRHFRAVVGRFDNPADKARLDELARWVEDYYRADLANRPSKHVYLRLLPPEIIARMNEVRESPVILDTIRRSFGADWVVTPMQHTDELYISHYNKDWGGDHGLFSKHYDGNLRFLPMGAVVRALIYVQSDATYKVVFGDSKVEHAFGSYEFGLLDFHRELHWVEGEYNPNDRQRILLKCNYLVAPRNAVWATRALMAANTGVFYVVKAAMEYSKSPQNLSQRLVGWVCNAARLLNNVHPLLPFAVIAMLIAALGWSVSALW